MESTHTHGTGFLDRATAALLPAESLSKWLSAAGMGVFMLMVFLTFVDVFLRYWFGKSINGTVEITELMMVIVVFSSIAYTQWQKSHVTMDILTSKLTEPRRALLAVATTLWSLATIDYIKEHYPAAKRLFLLGTPSMISEFEAAGFESAADSADDVPDVIVAAFDMTLQYDRLCRAAWWVSQGVPYIATNPDRVCPTDQPTVLVDCGSICACIGHATGRHPDITLGKPDPNMLSGILSRHGLKPDQIAMVGDRIYTDVAMAHNAKAMGVLVLSGETTLDVADKADPQPHITADSIEVLGRLIREAHGK